MWAVFGLEAEARGVEVSARLLELVCESGGRSFLAHHVHTSRKRIPYTLSITLHRPEYISLM
jgi:hypothetical protein